MNVFGVTASDGWGDGWPPAGSGSVLNPCLLGGSGLPLLQGLRGSQWVALLLAQVSPQEKQDNGVLQGTPLKPHHWLVCISKACSPDAPQRQPALLPAQHQLTAAPQRWAASFLWLGQRLSGTPPFCSPQLLFKGHTHVHNPVLAQPAGRGGCRPEALCVGQGLFPSGSSRWEQSSFHREKLLMGCSGGRRRSAGGESHTTANLHSSCLPPTLSSRAPQGLIP